MIKIKLHKILIFLILILAFSCAKYEDGPKFSLSTKKTRISNKWSYQSVLNYKTGEIKYSEYDGWTDYFDKQMAFTRTIMYLNEPTTYKGSWEFWNHKKQIKIKYKIRTRDTSEIYTILRLEKDTFWICDGEKEIHYMTYKAR